MAGRRRLAVRAGGSVDREERIRDQSARVRRIRGAHIRKRLSPLPAKDRCSSGCNRRRASLALRTRFSFRGFISQEELRELFYSSHIFLHPSETGADGNQEGVPNSMLEAMASWLPVFATIHGGIPEAIENDRSGILVAERDHRALAEQLLELVQSGDRLSELAQRGAEAVAEKFNDKKQVRLLEDFYFEAMNERA